MSKGSEYAIYMILLTGIKYLLYKFTRSEQLLVASPILKQREEGEYLNHLLVLRTQVNSEMTFKEFLFQVKQTVSEANENANYSIYKIIEQLEIPVEEEHFSLAKVMVILENIHDQKHITNEKWDTLFSFFLTSDYLEGKLTYDVAIYKKESMEKLIEFLFRFFESVTSNTSIKLSDVELITEEERYQQLYTFNDTQIDYPKEKTIYELFEGQVAKTPDRLAVIFDNKRLTYRELNERANQLARVIRNYGIEANQIVGLIAERSLEMIVGILGIMKAGGAYLPIDPEYPKAESSLC